MCIAAFWCHFECYVYHYARETEFETEALQRSIKVANGTTATCFTGAENVPIRL